jgi:hypothetical protein
MLGHLHHCETMSNVGKFYLLSGGRFVTISVPGRGVRSLLVSSFVWNYSLRTSSSTSIGSYIRYGL